MKKYPYLYLIALLLPALIINENVVQWVLAVRVGSYSVAGGFQDAFKYFSVFGYLFLRPRNFFSVKESKAEFGGGGWLVV